MPKKTKPVWRATGLALAAALPVAAFAQAMLAAPPEQNAMSQAGIRPPAADTKPVDPMSAPGLPPPGMAMTPPPEGPPSVGILPTLPTLSLPTSEYLGLPPPPTGEGVGPGISAEVLALPSGMLERLGPADVQRGFSLLRKAIPMPSGFTHQGAEIGGLGGSYRTRQGAAQAGKSFGNIAIYAAGSVLDDPGWRRDAVTGLNQFLGDLGWRDERTELHLNVLSSSTSASGGPVPYELLAIDREASFTSPNNADTDNVRLSFSGHQALSAQQALQGNLYAGYSKATAVYTLSAPYEPCASDSSVLCSFSAPLYTLDGQQVENWLAGSSSEYASLYPDGGPYAKQDVITTSARTYGGALSLDTVGELFGLHNQLAVGASFDGGNTGTAIDSTIGTLTVERNFSDPHGVVERNSARARSRYASVYMADSLRLTDRLSAAAGLRYNHGQLTRYNGYSSSGQSLDDSGTFRHFNPSFGLSYQVQPGLLLYGGHSVLNRVPTPDGVLCADMESQCAMPNFMIVNTALKQAVLRTSEIGARGQLPMAAGAVLTWGANAYVTYAADDLYIINDLVLGRPRFQNVGDTTRKGLKLMGGLRTGPWSLFANYAYTKATFQSSFNLTSPVNSAHDAANQIYIQPGDIIPGTARHQLKFGMAYAVTPKWKLGTMVTASSGTYLYGDEVNAMGKTSGWTVVGVNTQYHITEKVEVFGLIQNLLNENYLTQGSLLATGSTPILEAPGASDPRGGMPGAPRAFYAGVRLHF